MAKLGTKRQCQACGAKFYDLGKRPVMCSRCGAEAVLIGSKVEEMVDLPIMGTPSRLLVNRRRWECPSPTCGAKRWFEPNPVEEFSPPER